MRSVFGEIDIIVAAADLITVDLGTSSVPSGTNVNVTAKPRVGNNVVSATTTLGTGLSTCATDGTCNAPVAINLAAGTYTIEARATFQTP